MLAMLASTVSADGVSGAAGGANSQGANAQLETCSEPLGTLPYMKIKPNPGGIIIIGPTLL